MEYLIESSKGKFLHHMLYGELSITIKEDGCAFQVEYDLGYGILKYGKRSKTTSLITRPLEPFDILMNSSYYYASKYFEEHKDVFRPYGVFNFEILSKHEDHIIRNDNTLQEKDIEFVLISAYYNRDTPVDKEKLAELAEQLGVKVTEEVFHGKLSSEFISDLIQNPTEEYVYNAFKQLAEDNGHPINHSIEGFVIEPLGGTRPVARMMKVIEPGYKAALKTLLNSQLENRSLNYEDIYIELLAALREGERLFYRAERPLGYIIEVFKLIKDREHILEMMDNVELQPNMKHDIQWQYLGLDCPIYETDGSKKAERQDKLFRFMIFALRRQRLKRPLWCSMDFQRDRINRCLLELHMHEVDYDN